MRVTTTAIRTATTVEAFYAAAISAATNVAQSAATVVYTAIAAATAAVTAATAAAAATTVTATELQSPATQPSAPIWSDGSMNPSTSTGGNHQVARAAYGWHGDPDDI